MTDGSPLSPIGLSTYARLDHLKRTVESLQRNTLAADSDLFVFSDGARPGDEQRVGSVRRYLRTISGFRSIEIVERAENNRVQNNRGGMKYLAENYGRFIWIEDDLVLAPDLVGYMNRMLDFYKDDARVFAITGWSPPIKVPAHYGCDVYLATSFCSWTFAMWADRFLSSNYRGISRESWERFLGDPGAQKFLAANGSHVLPLVRADVSGEIDALDAKFCLHQALNRCYSLHPRVSLAKNIGLDNSGAHCSDFHGLLDWEDSTSAILLPCRQLPCDAKIQKAYRRFSDKVSRALSAKHFVTAVRRRLGVG